METIVMKFLKPLLFLVTISFSLISCSKPETIRESINNDEDTVNSESNLSNNEKNSLVVSFSLPNEQFPVDSLLVGSLYELNITSSSRETFFYKNINVSVSTDLVTIKPRYSYSNDIDYREIKYLVFVNDFFDCLYLKVNYKDLEIRTSYPVFRNQFDFTFVTSEKSNWKAKDEILVAHDKDDYFSLCSNNGIKLVSIDDDVFADNNLVLIHQFTRLDLLSIDFKSVLEFDSTLYFQIIAEYETEKFIGDASNGYVFYIAIPKSSHDTLKKNCVSLTKGEN